MTLPSNCNLNTPLPNEMTSAIRLHFDGEKLHKHWEFGDLSMILCCVSVFVICFDWLLSEWYNLSLQISKKTILGTCFSKNSTPLAINPSTELPQLTLGSPEVPLMDSTRSPAAMGCVGLLLFHSGTAPSAWQRAKGIPKNLMGYPTSVGYNGIWSISWYFLIFLIIWGYFLTSSYFAGKQQQVCPFSHISTSS